ncbi:MAG: outer membrane beta-barrel protein, partial [Polyangiaceae bacterium]
MFFRSFSLAAAPAVALLLLWSSSAGAQPAAADAGAEDDGAPTVSAPPAGSAPLPASPPPQPPAEAAKPALSVTPVGYVEAYYAYNLNRPSNGITNYRGFDNRHNTFTLQNAALGANFEAGPVGGRLVLQVGAIPSTSYLSEPALSGTGSVNATGPELWKYLQEAYVTYKAPVGRGLLFQLGLCASPIGFETFAVKDNWNWSRSNLFFGLPAYHTGLRVTYPWTDELSTTVSIFN